MGARHTLSFMRRRPLPATDIFWLFMHALCGVRCAVAIPARVASGAGLRAEEIGVVLAASTAIHVFAGPAVGHIVIGYGGAHRR